MENTLVISRRSLRHILWLVTLCLCIQVVHAQSAAEETTPEYRHVLGLSTLGLFDLAQSGPSDTKFRSPYLFTYSYEMKNIVLRGAIGPEYTSETIVHDGFTDQEENTFLRLDVRIGMGFVILEDQRWQAIAGVDGVTHYLRDRKIKDSGFDRITDQEETRSYGGGPFVQIAFHLSRRISLGVESSIYFMTENFTKTQLFENFPDFDNLVSENTGTELNVNLPNTLFVRLHF